MSNPPRYVTLVNTDDRTMTFNLEVTHPNYYGSGVHLAECIEVDYPGSSNLMKGSVWVITDRNIADGEI